LPLALLVLSLATCQGAPADDADPETVGMSQQPITVANVSAGDQFTCISTTDGTVWCWGQNLYGRLGGERPVPGEWHQVVMTSSASPLTGVKSVSTGFKHACALTLAGTVYCWGFNASGQVGDGTTTDRFQAVQVSGLSSVAELALGGDATDYHSCAIKTDGTLWCWGHNTDGQLGDGTTTHTSTPVQAGASTLGSNVAEVALGGYHSCAIKTDGTLWCWGANSRGQLGDGTTANTSTPVQAGASTLGSNVAKVALGIQHSCARKTDGTLWCWGWNNRGQLGDGTTADKSTPVQAGASTLGSNVAAVDLGGNLSGGHSCARKTDGTLWCWGYNTNGQLGDGTTADKTTPVQAGASTLGSAVAEVTLGGYHSCARKTDGTLWCWGWNYAWQLGNGDSASQSPAPVPVKRLHDYANDGICGVNETRTSSPADCPPTSCGDGKCEAGETLANCPTDCHLLIGAATGTYHSCAIKTDGTLWCWGYNNFGQLGDGTDGNTGVNMRSTPVQAGASTLGNAVAAVALGGDNTNSLSGHSCARKTDGTLWCWGGNAQGQLGDGTTANKSTPVQAGASTLGSNVAEVAVGLLHACARKIDGALWCWGFNGNGQLGDGTTANKSTPVQAGASTLGNAVAKVALGNGHSCALKTDGTLWCWGANTFGQLGDGTTMQRTTPVQAGASTLGSNVADFDLGESPVLASNGYTCARKTDGTLWCWGGNTFGQLGDGTVEDKTTPVQIGASTLGGNVAEVALGALHSCARTTDGTLWCWGANYNRQLGRMGGSSAFPTQVPWCGDGICSVGERDTGSCVADCTPTAGDAVCDPFLDCSLFPEIPAWECDTDCCSAGGSCGNGLSCDTATDCASGFCVGGFCCETDTCQTGVCDSANTCPAPDGCHEAGTCNPITGQCWYPASPDGMSCSDGDACTQMDTCQSGACVAGAAVTMCAAMDQCHDAGTCDPVTGQCSNPAKADGASCSDGDGCTQADTCQSGACVAGAAVTCTASDPCHEAGTCDPATGMCSNPAKEDGTPCSDGNACTQMDTCQSGACAGASPVLCTASDECHDAGTCDPATGMCSNPAKANGTACNDDNACTQTDTCQNGACAGGTAVSCTASDECHEVGTCDPVTGCSNPPKPDGCWCSGGACVGGVCTPVGSSSSSGPGSGGSGHGSSGHGGGGGGDPGEGCSFAPAGGSSSSRAAWLGLGLLLALRRRNRAMGRQGHR
jgi:alpha-tubulin suppressor-like RCC1 family protein